MPTYEYHCEKCGHDFEVFQSISAQPLEKCPKEKCAQKKWGRGRVTKKISAGAGLLFKGSGFYITDYRSEKYKDAVKKESAPVTTEKKGAAEKPAKTEATPAPAKAGGSKSDKG